MRRWLLGALLVTVGWLASPASVPIYDGIGTDEPYRSVGESPGPSDASVTVKVSGGLAEPVTLQTAEQGPQLIASLSGGALRTTGAALRVTAVPLAPQGTPPRGTFDGNAYRITTSPAATLDPDAVSCFVFLRADVMTKPNPVVLYRSAAAAAWREIPSKRYGRDNLSAGFAGPGDYVLARLPGSKPVSSGGLGLTRVLFLGGGVLFLVVVTVLVLRRPRADDDL